MTATRRRLRKLLRDNRGFLLFILLMSLFRSAVADWNSVPTSSMYPTIVPGDRILVDKLAYDLQLPFTGTSLFRHTDPARGEIVVFDSVHAGKRLVKRVVGEPGDRVAMVDNRLVVNGVAVIYRPVAEGGGWRLDEELLPETPHLVRTRVGGSPWSSFETIQVPAGYYLMMGDNRDESADSRVIGLVPRDEIVGRTRTVVISLDYDDYLRPRMDRFMTRL